MAQACHQMCTLSQRWPLRLPRLLQRLPFLEPRAQEEEVMPMTSKVVTQAEEEEAISQEEATAGPQAAEANSQEEAMAVRQVVATVRGQPPSRTIQVNLHKVQVACRTRRPTRCGRCTRILLRGGPSTGISA